MNIVTEKNVNGRIKDGIETMLNLNGVDFDEVCNYFEIYPKKNIIEEFNFCYVTDPCELPERPISLGLEPKNMSRYYISRTPEISEIFRVLDANKAKYPKDSREYTRINRLLKSRDIEALKKLHTSVSAEDREFMDKLFDILQNDEIFEKFMDFENNADFFKIEDVVSDKNAYLRYIAEIFGDARTGESSKITEISKKFYIPQLPEIVKRVAAINKEFNLERYTVPEYQFRGKTFPEFEYVIRRDDEPDWQINPELYNAVYDGMPNDLSLEEQALYIYGRLCIELGYDEEYEYKDKGISAEFESDFSKEKLEAIVPKSKITCYDFSRIYAKFINQLPGDIEAVAISKGVNMGHFLAGFYTDKVSARLEAININADDPSNDLMKAKAGMKLNGIKVVSDRDNVLPLAEGKVYSLIYGKDPTTINDLINSLRSEEIPEVPNDIRAKLDAVIKTMREKGIDGNEFVQTMSRLFRADYFGKDIQKAYIGSRSEQNGEKHIQRNILMRDKNNVDRLYFINTRTLEITEPSKREIVKKLTTGEYLYEDNTKRIPGISREDN